MDKVTKKKRSEIMSKIKSKDTLPEIIMSKIMKKQDIGFIKQPNLLGHPDFFIGKFNCCVFVHGCFWHGCKKHFKMPKTNRAFWANKIFNNIRRHKENRRKLEKMGLSVIEIWEHDLR